MNEIYSLSQYTTEFEKGCEVFYGPHAAASFLLSAVAEISVNRPLHLLDFGNRCDMYYVARQLRFLTRDPAAAMRNIRLQRAFTCYQALSLLHQLPKMEIDVPVIILDLLTPFLDENIKTAEIFRIFGASVSLLQEAMKEHLLLIGVKPVPQKLAPDRVCMVNHLARVFGIIPILPQNSEAEDYRLRPASRAFGMPENRTGRAQREELPSGQPSLFDLLPGQ